MRRNRQTKSTAGYWPESVTSLTPQARLQNQPTNRKVTVKSWDTPTHTLTHNVTVFWSSLVCILVSPQKRIENPLSTVPSDQGKDNILCNYIILGFWLLKAQIISYFQVFYHCSSVIICFREIFRFREELW